MSGFAPSLPPEGQLVTIPLKVGTNDWYASTLAVVTGAEVTAAKTFESDGISYAELRLIGLIVEMVSSGPPALLHGFQVTSLSGDGNIPALYGTQIALAQVEAYKTAAVAGAAAGTGYARLVIIGLRDKAEIAKTQKVKSVIKAFAPAAAAAGTIRFTLSASAVFNKISDKQAEQNDSVRY